MDREELLIAAAIEYFRKEAAPSAELMDRDPRHLANALRGLAERDLLALKRPERWGGPELSDPAFRRFQEETARVSGTLAFLQTQHQSAGMMIAGGENEALKDEYLPQMGDGRKLVGIGFSQLRRPGPPIMRAERTDGGYELNGHVPWVTGFAFYPEFLIGAARPDGQSVIGVVPMVDGPGVRVSEPMALAAMSAANTVTVDFDQFFLADERVATIKPAGWIANSDMINLALQGSFAMGCAQAGLDILRRNAERRKSCAIEGAFDMLSDELERCRASADELRDDLSAETLPDRLALRAWQVELAARCAHAAVTSSAGAANSIDHPAQRVYREALVFTVSAQTTAIMEATLARLTR